MSPYWERCFQALAEHNRSRWPDRLERSPVTEADIQAVEAAWGYRFPEDFRAFLRSYILPPTWACGRFYGSSADDWPGGGSTYSPELDRYLDWDEIPDDLNICTLKFSLCGLEGMANTGRHSLQENIERLSWGGTAPLGYLLIGEFTDYLVFLECETGEVVYIDHDFYTMSHQTAVENIKEYKWPLCKSFSDFLNCLCLGAVCREGVAVPDQ